MGDFNIDFFDRNQQNRNLFIDLFKKFACKQLITDITRPGRHKSSCLDWILTNCCFVSDTSCLNIMIADHFAVSSVRKKSREHVPYIYRDIRDYTMYNSKEFTDLLRNRLHQSNYLLLPISNKSLCALRRQRNMVNSKIETAKKNYIYKILNENSKNPRKFWKLVNELLNGKKTSTEYVQFIDPVTNDPISQGREATFMNSFFLSYRISNNDIKTTRLAFFVDVALLKFIRRFELHSFFFRDFCNITERLGLDNPIDHDEYHRIDIDLDELYGHIETNFDLVNDLVTTAELEYVVSSIDISKGSSIPGISTFICKDIMKFLPCEIVFLFNFSIQTSIFPQRWAN